MIPEIIHDFMRQGAALVVSISGGKDSQAMAEEINSTFKSGNSLADICDGCG